MYQVPPPKEPNGCLQTVVISRMIAQILFVPMLLILGGIVCILLALYAFAEHVLLGVAVVVIAIAVLTVISKWEYDRVKRDLPPPGEDPADPRMR
jgi:hypothetical protein